MPISSYLKTILPKKLYLILKSVRRKIRYQKIRTIDKRIDKKLIKEGLWQLGLKEGDTVIVYSSLSSLGYVIGGADTVIDALLEIIGNTGNLIMPAFPFSGSCRDYLATKPLFDPKSTPSRMGIITEVFRKRNSVLRSIHPTHSISVKGPKADWIIRNHEKSSTAFGKGSPFYELLKLNCWLLSLGVDIHVFTHYHTFEDIIENFPYKVYLDNLIPARIMDESGVERIVMTKVHDPNIARTRIDHTEGRNIRDKMRNYFIEYKIIKSATIGNATGYLLKSQDLIKTLNVLLQKGITIYGSR